jgi:hypothetical protein
LKDDHGPFTHAIHLDELIIAALIPPAKDWAAKFIPLSFSFDDIFVHIHA